MPLPATSPPLRRSRPAPWHRGNGPRPDQAGGGDQGGSWRVLLQGVTGNRFQGDKRPTQPDSCISSGDSEARCDFVVTKAVEKPQCQHLPVIHRQLCQIIVRSQAVRHRFGNVRRRFGAVPISSRQTSNPAASQSLRACGPRRDALNDGSRPSSTAGRPPGRAGSNSETASLPPSNAVTHVTLPMFCWDFPGSLALPGTFVAR